jgi:hypothetical protein
VLPALQENDDPEVEFQKRKEREEVIRKQEELLQQVRGTRAWRTVGALRTLDGGRGTL